MKANDCDKHSSLIHRGGLQPCPQILGTDDRDEHSSLLRYGIESIIKKLDMGGTVIMLCGIMLNANCLVALANVTNVAHINVP